MKDKKHLVQLILAIITFTVLLIFVVNHLHIISGFFGMVFSVLLPFLIGCGIAFVLNIPMRGIEQGIFKNEKNACTGSGARSAWCLRISRHCFL